MNAFIITSFIQISTLIPRLRSLFSGVLIACGFAPTHLPGLSFLGLALFFSHLNKQQSLKSAWISGFELGLGCMGLGVSWIYVSIHLYGNLSIIWSLLATALFVMYLALFPAFMATLYAKLRRNTTIPKSILLFCSLWVLSEFLRSIVFGGFPWLMVGVSQMDTPLHNLFPIIGIYGVSFITCLAACCLSMAIQKRWSLPEWGWLTSFVFIILSPSALSVINWSILDDTPISVGVAQINVSMRNKWDEKYFWHLINQYQNAIASLISKNSLVVLPESAIPVPPDYIHDLLDQISQQAKAVDSAVLVGIPQVATKNEYFNTMMSLGKAKGSYFKQQLVPFGEYTPLIFKDIMDLMGLPPANILPHRQPQSLITVNGHPLAALICYEIAYPELLRQQLPKAQWIVSISDDGWFGHSFAMYQQLQMAQVLAIQTARYHVVANNDGLSSVINSHGQIIASLPAFSVGALNSWLQPATGATLWVRFGDRPILFFCLLVIVGILLTINHKTCSNEN